MSTCYENLKGTFQIVDLPPGVVKLPFMFQYKLKTGPNSETVKCKARLCARGDLQIIVAIVVQAGLTLYQFDIRCAFLCVLIDREIYLKLPQGYEPPPGKTAKLLCSLYGLKQAPSAFHSLFESWLLHYWFTAI
eukprot:778477-Rhodomonas_salina.1